MDRKVYITSVSDISTQNPLTDEWLRKYVKPLEVRRMGALLRRAITTAHTAVEASGIECPDAIIGGTGYGQVSDTEALLNTLCHEGENSPQPTHFMHSTHNTVCSQIAVRLKCHGYNCTYVQGGISFECALFDALLQIKSHEASNILVTANDELTPDHLTLLRKSGYASEESPYKQTESSLAMMLQAEPSAEPLCTIEDVRLIYGASQKEIENQTEQLSGNEPYTLFTDTDYKPLYGDNFSVSALGIYSAALKVKEQGCNVIFLNRCDKECAITLLKPC